MEIVEIGKIYEKSIVVKTESSFILRAPNAPSGLAIEIPGRFFCNLREIEMLRMHTRAIPDSNYALANCFPLSEFFSDDIPCVLQFYARFGQIYESKEYACSILRILPPEYATDMQVIVRARGRIDSVRLMEFLKEAHRCDFVCNVAEAPYTVASWTTPITTDLNEARYAAATLWQALISSTTWFNYHRSVYNSWLDAPDFL